MALTDLAVRGRVVDAALVELVLLVVDDLGAVELVEEGEQRAPVLVVRDAASVVTLPGQVAQRVELHIL